MTTTQKSIGTIVAFAMLAMTGCASTPDRSAVRPYPANASTANTGICESTDPLPPTPTVEQVSSIMKKLLDPNVPLGERTQYVQGSDDDPEVLNRLIPVMRDANYSAVFHNIEDYCNGTATANATVTFNGRTNDVQIPLVIDRGAWKLNKVWACGLMDTAEISSPMCIPAK